MWKLSRCNPENVLFPGGIYGQDALAQLRYWCAFYIHGHRVGGTNPSLVEALGAGNAVLAHDNKFNRWVCNDAAIYFVKEDEITSQCKKLFSNKNLLSNLKSKAICRHQTYFRWEPILDSYDNLFREMIS